jgi:hypothetical protein
MASSVMFAQTKDTFLVKKDSIVTLILQQTAYQKLTQNLFKNNSTINLSKPESITIITPKKKSNTEFIFYLLAGLVLLLGCLKAFFGKYFNMLFSVFFNTSLRQSQLTDQLLQAKLPSLLFNVFFVVSGGIYVYFLLQYFNLIPNKNVWLVIGSCVVVLALIYLSKFATLKLTGWLVGNNDATNTYIFIIFLINKIIGILLVPFTIIIAFSSSTIINAIIFISLITISLLLLLRFFRSYGLLQNQLKISRFHFFLYLTGVEVLPLLLIYKVLVVFLSKNL